MSFSLDLPQFEIMLSQVPLKPKLIHVRMLCPPLLKAEFDEV
jgi:hypothetical protein